MQVDQPEPSVSRRSFLRGAAAVGALATAPGLLSACSNTGGATPTASGSAPGQVSSRGKIKIGFIALTDCASVVMAHELGCTRSTASTWTS